MPSPAGASRRPPDQSASFREAIEPGQLSFTHEYRFRRADCSYANILDRGYILRDREKRPVRVLGAMIDLTERKQMAEQLDQTKRLGSLGRRAGSISHEFNNVLMGVQANAEIINGRAARQTLSLHWQRARRSPPRAEDHRGVPAVHASGVTGGPPLNVRRLLEGWADQIRPTLRSTVELRVDVDGHDLWILADPQQIAQVFTNVAFNARDAMPEAGGTLSVRLPSGWSGRPTVSSTSDWPTTDRASALSGWPTCSSRSTPPSEGTGLGLAVSYQIETGSDGHIFVESELGAGTTFHIFLPLCGAEEAAAVPEPAPAIALGRVLLVERRAGGRRGREHAAGSRGRRCPRRAQRQRGDPRHRALRARLDILDIGLPDIDGVEVYEGIARRWPDLRVLFSSGHARAANLEQRLSRPNVGLLVKPYEMSELRTALRRLLVVEH